MMLSFFGNSANPSDASQALSRFQQVKEFKNIASILSELTKKKDALAERGAEIMASMEYKMASANKRFTVRSTQDNGEEKIDLKEIDERPLEIKKAEILIKLLKLINDRIEKFNEGHQFENIILEKKSKYFLMKDLVLIIDDVLVNHSQLLNEFRNEDSWLDMNAVTHYGSRLAAMLAGMVIASPAGMVAGAVGLMGGAIGGKYLEHFIKNNIDIQKAPKSLQLVVQLQEAVTKQGIILEINLGDELLNATSLNLSDQAKSDAQEKEAKNFQGIKPKQN